MSIDIYEGGCRLGHMEIGGDIYLHGSRQGYFSGDDMYQSGCRRGYISGDDLYVDGSRVGYMNQSGDMYVGGSRRGEIRDDGDIYVDGSRWGQVQATLNGLEEKMYVFAFLYAFTNALCS